jgi:hypothetical protein
MPQNAELPRRARSSGLRQRRSDDPCHRAGGVDARQQPADRRIGGHPACCELMPSVCRASRMLPMAKIRTFGVHASAKGGTADARRSRADIHSQSGNATNM